MTNLVGNNQNNPGAPATRQLLYATPSILVSIFRKLSVWSSVLLNSAFGHLQIIWLPRVIDRITLDNNLNHHVFQCLQISPQGNTVSVWKPIAILLSTTPPLLHKLKDLLFFGWDGRNMLSMISSPACWVWCSQGQVGVPISFYLMGGTQQWRTGSTDDR